MSHALRKALPEPASRPLRRGKEEDLDGMIGNSPLFLEAMERFRKLVRSHAPAILLTGESGTGKTFCVRGVHARYAEPNDLFLSIQCSALTPPLLEEEIFGIPRRSDALQSEGKPGLLDLADSGTLFLDELQECPPELDARFAQRILEESGNRLLRSRVVAAADSLPHGLDPHRPSGIFHVLLLQNTVELPPLRNRGEDVILLANHFLEKWAERCEASLPHLEKDALKVLYEYHWPGNVRELRSVIESAAVLAHHGRIRREHLRLEGRQDSPTSQEATPSKEAILIPPEGKKWERVEEEVIQATLDITGGNRSAAARILGISRPTLGRKIRKYHLHAPLLSENIRPFPSDPHRTIHSNQKGVGRR